MSLNLANFTTSYAYRASILKHSLTQRRVWGRDKPLFCTALARLVITDVTINRLSKGLVFPNCLQFMLLTLFSLLFCHCLISSDYVYSVSRRNTFPYNLSKQSHANRKNLSRRKRVWKNCPSVSYKTIIVIGVIMNENLSGISNMKMWLLLYFAIILSSGTSCECEGFWSMHRNQSHSAHPSHSLSTGLRHTLRGREVDVHVYNVGKLHTLLHMIVSPCKTDSPDSQNDMCVTIRPSPPSFISS